MAQQHADVAVGGGQGPGRERAPAARREAHTLRRESWSGPVRSRCRQGTDFVRSAQRHSARRGPRLAAPARCVGPRPVVGQRSGGGGSGEYPRGRGPPSPTRRLQGRARTGGPNTALTGRRLSHDNIAPISAHRAGVGPPQGIDMAAPPPASRQRRVETSSPARDLLATADPWKPVPRPSDDAGHEWITGAERPTGTSTDRADQRHQQRLGHHGEGLGDDERGATRASQPGGEVIITTMARTTPSTVLAGNRRGNEHPHGADHAPARQHSGGAGR